MYLKSLSNVERISDHAVNVAELAHELATKKIVFSEKAMAELEICLEAVSEIAEITHELEDNYNKVRSEGAIEKSIIMKILQYKSIIKKRRTNSRIILWRI